MPITRLVIRNYRGIAALELDVPPHGAIAKGRSGAGKTTILEAVEAALCANDIGADAIRKGADRAEILVDLNDHNVRRVITSKGSTVTVMKDGMKAPKPQAYLQELLGTSSLDPMDLLLLKGKARRAKILEALPVSVTVEQLRQWVPKIPESYDCSGHGLEVIERVRTKAYDQRTAANAKAKDVRAECDHAAKDAERLCALVPKERLDVGDCEANAKKLASIVADLQTRDREAKASAQRTEASRAKISQLRASAEVARNRGTSVIPASELATVESAIKDCVESIDSLRRALAAAESNHARAQETLRGMLEQNSLAESNRRDAESLTTQADALESALAHAAVEPVEPELLANAIEASGHAQQVLTETQAAWTAYGAADAAMVKANILRAALTDADAEAERLDVIVKALTNEAPGVLLAQCDGIPGLSLDGDEVLLDGVRLDTLAGSEQVRFAVEVARRANAKSKILIVDGLERLDPELLDVFIPEATRDGWQLLGTRVDRGDMVIEAIESHGVADAAE